VTDGKEGIDSLMNQGLTLINGNRLAEAMAHYEAVVARYPRDADAWYMLGTVNARLDLIDAAGECSRRAIELRPDFGEAHLNLGNVLLHQGRHEEALAEYGKVLALNPRHGGAYLNMGHILAALDRDDESALSYRTALGLDPSGAAGKAIRQQAQTLLQHGRLATAKTVLSVICDCRPDDADAWHLLSTVNGRLGNIDAAAACSRRVLAMRPDHAEAHVNLGHAYFQQGDVDTARAQYLKALDIDPLSVAALNNLGSLCKTRDHFNTYLKAYRKAVASMPNPSKVRAAFIEVIENIVPSDYDPWLDKELLQCYSISGIDYKPLSLTTAAVLRRKYNIRNANETDETQIHKLIDQISGDALFITFLEKTINIDSELERVLTQVRRTLLLKSLDRDGLDERWTRVVAAFAYHGHNNEYVYSVDEEEERLIQSLRRSIDDRTATSTSPDRDLERDLYVFGMYDQLHSLSCRSQLLDWPLSAWSAGIRALVKESLINPAKEEKIKREIPSLGTILHSTSQLVQSQYEENPYPRWLDIAETQQTNLRRVLQQQFSHFTPPAYLEGPIQILVAGCGTGKQPIQTAMSYKKDNVEILAVDISRSSLAYAMRMARGYGVENIQFMQCDILELAQLNRRFHVIECRGVLHHMQDPVAGWRVLSNLLVDGGMMSLALYSKIARRELTPFREMFKSLGMKPDRRNMRHFRNKIMRGEIDEYRIHSYDFYSTSGCRDLIFHFIEHEFTPPQLNEIMTELNLEFVGFTLKDINVKNRYRAHYPQDPDMTNLVFWQQFENIYPNTFSKMYQFWCQMKPVMTTAHNGGRALGAPIP
jgi:tetratricopeptide (TPR) repeat protein/2-polyprenyl-3-methyl-5-hydroxy-6-metoxy-1,4-benzoquinol methylase